MKKKKKLLALLLAICVVGLYSFSTSIFVSGKPHVPVQTHLNLR
ncbi:hypothetical protein [Aminicella lysinilytica]|uniref:Uncharacterized protein n=1 Tax=Aminicella lysinilytica TaxID=433323 RepID=A0A4R6PX52_9FIRM|nr:hypothetical protein [Aminicella lysinilytica]TDP44674.1 hypothetical protein EV211_1701 [Aminicella lysinilytica]